MAKINKVITVLLSVLIFPQLSLAKESVTIALTLEPPHLDPTQTAAEATAEVVYGNIFEGLVQINEKSEVEPCLAKKWEVSDDALVYTFFLREGVKFHNGQTLSAGDVVYSLNAARSENSKNANKKVFEPIQDVKEVEPHIVQIILKHPSSEFLFKLGFADSIIVSKQDHDKNTTHPNGTGPYKFVEWVKGDHIEIQKFDDYWGKNASIPKGFFKFISDASIQITSILSGQIDAIPNMSSPELVEHLSENNEFTVAVGSTEGETLLAMNNKAKPLDNIKVRQAISHAINKKELIDGAMYGYATPIGSHFSPNHPAYLDLSDTYPFSIEKAKQLLEEAGIKQGHVLTLKVPPTSYAKRGSEVIAAQLKRVGLEIKIQPIEWAQWLEQVYKNKEYDLTIISHTEPIDIDRYAIQGYYFNYENSTFNSLIDKATKTVNDQERFEYYQEAQKILAKDAVNVFLFQLPKLGIWKSNLNGLWHNSPIQATILRNVYWK